jgi:RNA polymerase sigma-70 factor, ECF subfamily
VRLLNPQSLVRHTDHLHRAACAQCGSGQDAEDLVQETFTRARPPPSRARRAERAGLSDACVEQHVPERTARRLTQAARGVTLENVEVLDWHATQAPQQALEVGEPYAAIAELPERYRLTLVAVDLLGLSYGEAGCSLGVREATVATRLFRARQLVVGRLLEERAAW